MSEVTPTIEVMPMTTPSTVSPDWSLLARNVSSAMRRISPMSPLFTAQRLDGIQAGGARRGVGAEEQPDAGGDADAEDHRPGLETRGQRAEIGDGLRGQESEHDPD